MLPSVRIATYNILSPALVASHAPHTPDAFLASSHRLPLLLRALQPEVDARAVICLQEVAIAWVGPLHTFFCAAGYQLVTACYGTRKNGFMGVALAVPTAQYELLGAEVVCVSDTKAPRAPPHPPPLPPPPPPSPLQRLLAACCLPGPGSEQGGTWATVRGRVNQLASVRLRARAGAGGGDGLTFCVSCYHMPCLFMDRPVMSAHCALAAQAAHAFAAGQRYVLAGDFNIKPVDPQYELLTRGAASRELPPPEFEGDSWRPTVAPLASAYAQANGREPPFTNYAQQTRDAAPFIETCVGGHSGAPLHTPLLTLFSLSPTPVARLDYIFLSPGWRAAEAKALPSAAEVASPMPNEQQASDHLLLAATLVATPLAPAPLQ